MPRGKSTYSELICSFCGISRTEVTHMFKGKDTADPTALVCSNCLIKFKQQLIKEGIIK